MTEKQKLKLIRILIEQVYDQERWDEGQYLLAILDSIYEIIFFENNVAQSNKIE